MHYKVECIWYVFCVFSDDRNVVIKCDLRERILNPAQLPFYGHFVGYRPIISFIFNTIDYGYKLFVINGEGEYFQWSMLSHLSNVI